MKFYDYIDSIKDKKINIYSDLDGVLAEYDIGNFDYNTIRPLKTNIKRIEELSKRNNISFKILTICKNNKIIEEKKVWIKKYMPFFDLEDVVFISKEDIEDKEITSADLKSMYLKDCCKDDDINIVIDDDIRIISNIRKKNENVTIYHVSSWID